MINLETKEILRHIASFHKEAKREVIWCIKRKRMHETYVNFMNKINRQELYSDLYKFIRVLNQYK